MRILWLCLLAILSYLVAMVVLFPAAPVVDRLRPQLGPIALEGVNGKLFKGSIDTVRSTDDLLPLVFSNVGWTLAPQTLLSGAAGASIGFDAYGGSGSGLVSRSFNGDVTVSDFVFTVQAKELEVLLPVPIASFAGEVSGQFDTVRLVDNLLDTLDGRLSWTDAALQAPVPASLGTVTVDIVPEAGQSHKVTLKAAGGDVIVDGSVTVTTSGDFVADILLTPSPGAAPEIVQGLRQIGPADSRGRVRLQRKGNVNRLM